MAFVHESSAEYAKSDLNIFQIPPTQTSIKKSFYVAVQPIAAITDNMPMECFISGSGEYYYDLNNTLLHVVCRIVSPDDTPIPD